MISGMNMNRLVWEREGGTHNVIHKFVSEDVWHEEDGLVLRMIDFGSDDVGLDAVNLLIRPYALVGNRGR